MKNVQISLDVYFTHKYINSNDIIINNNNDFTYNAHINLAKK